MVSKSQWLVKVFTEHMEQGCMPDSLVRWGIRRLLQQRAKAFNRRTPSKQIEAKQQFLQAMRVSELFAFNRGREWWVAHYLFKQRGTGAMNRV